jgi:hypothetical protein
MTVCPIAIAIKSQGRHDGKQTEYLAGMLALSPLAARAPMPKISFRRDPKFQAERYDRHCANAAEPKCCEPQQAPCQRPSLLPVRRQ